MFESILRHKQVVIAAIAITALAGYVVPLNQFAVAQQTTDPTDTVTVDDFIAQSNTATTTQTSNPSITQNPTQTNAIVNEGDATGGRGGNADSGDATSGDASAFSAASACGDCDKEKKKDWDKSKDGKKRDGSGGGDASSAAFAATGDATTGDATGGRGGDATIDQSGNNQQNFLEQNALNDVDQTSTTTQSNDATQINDNYLNLRLDGLFDD